MIDTMRTARTRAHRRAWGWALLGIAASLVASGCGDDDDEADRTSAPPSRTPATITPPPADANLTEDMGEAGTALTGAGCSFGQFNEEEAVHVDDAGDLDFDSSPPSSGTHYPDWAPFGSYDGPIDDGYAVHNLEHGGVVVWLGTEVDDGTTDAISDLLDDEEKWIVAPRTDTPGLYSAAWSKGLSCPPAALAKLGATGTADALEAWYETVVSTGSDAEKDVPAYAGSMKEPTPERDISADPPS